MKRINEPLQGLLDSLGLAESMERWKAVELWPAVVGERAAARTRAVAVRNGELLVEVENPGWMNELTYVKPRALLELNRRLEGMEIKDIRFLPASSTPPPRKEA